MKSSYVKLSDEEFDLFMKGEHPTQLNKTVETTKPTPPGEEISADNKPDENQEALCEEEKPPEITKEDKIISILIEEVKKVEFSFSDTEIDDICVGDISQLLYEYKQLAILNECMKKVLMKPPKSILSSRLTLKEEPDAKEISNVTARRSRTTSSLKNAF